MNRYPSRGLLLLLILPLLMSRCVPTQPPRAGTPSTVKGPTLTAAFAALPMSLAPYGPHSWYKTQVLPLLYDGLITLDENLQPLPALAASWEVSADGLVYTMRLRQQVKFHHGKALESTDVRYTFQQAAASQTFTREGWAPFALIASIETPDSQTVRFVLKEPYAPFLTKLTVACCPIVPHNSPTPSESVPPGTGPFQLINFQPGQAITLEKFAAYWDRGLPRLEAVRLRAVKNATTRLQMLYSGEVDYALLEPLYQRPLVAADRNQVTVVTSAPTGTFSVVFNTRRQPFADANVRRAFARAIDKVALAQQVLGSYGVPVNQPFNPDASPWYVDVADHVPDLRAARELLARAGYADVLRVNLPVIASATLFTKTALTLREQLQPAGIDLQVELSAAESVRQKIQQDTWDVLLRGEESPTDADDVYFMAFHASRVGTGNISAYHTADLDALLSLGRRTRALGERQQIYRQVVHKIQQDVPELYLFMARWPVAWRQGVQGYDGRLLQCCLLHTLTHIANQGFKTIWLAE